MLLRISYRKVYMKTIEVGPNDQYYASISPRDGKIIYSVWRNGAGIEGRADEAVLIRPDGTMLNPAEQPVSGGPEVPAIKDWSNAFTGVANNPDYDPKNRNLE